jgi:hypothetical protein
MGYRLPGCCAEHSFRGGVIQAREKRRFNTEDAEEEHGGHREEKRREEKNTE